MGNGHGVWSGGSPRRTTFVDDRAWSAFSELKAGIVGRKGESAVALELQRLGHACLYDVILADLFGLTQVDHLVCAPDGIVVLETKTLAGHITGTLEAREWVQCLGDGQRHRAFQNPVQQNYRHCRAVEAAVAGSGVRVRGYVVSAGAATFGGDLKAVVVPLARLGQIFCPDGGVVISSVLAGGWTQLVAAASSAEGRREEHSEMVRCLR